MPDERSDLERRIGRALVRFIFTGDDSAIRRLLDALDPATVARVFPELVGPGSDSEGPGRVTVPIDLELRRGHPAGPQRGNDG